MPSGLIWFIAVIGITALVLIVRYVVSVVVNKGADAINNAIVDKKNRENPRKPENLSDRFKAQ